MSQGVVGVQALREVIRKLHGAVLQKLRQTFQCSGGFQPAAYQELGGFCTGWTPCTPFPSSILQALTQETGMEGLT